MSGRDRQLRRRVGVFLFKAVSARDPLGFVPPTERERETGTPHDTPRIASWRRESEKKNLEKKKEEASVMALKK